MDDKIINTVNTLLIEEFEVDPETITPDANFKDTLDLDSLDYIDLIAITEANFGCKMGQEDFNNIITFRDFYKYIAAHIKVKESI